MADESPQQIRERVLAEELGKGSDPRVAEGRAKAAEMRARLDLPIEPDQAWRALLEREGKSPDATPEAVSATTPPEAEQEAASKPAPEEAAERAAATADGVGTPAGAQEAPAGAQEAPAGAQEAPAAIAQPVSVLAPVAAAPPPAPVQREPEYEPEIGQPVEREDQSLEILAGIRVGDSRLPLWLVVVLVTIPIWAIFYLAAFAGAGAVARTTNCTTNPDHTFVCFQKEAETSGETSH